MVSLERGYHGGTNGDWAVCGLPEMVEAYRPMLPTGFPKIPPAYCYRCPIGKTYPSCAIACADTVGDAIREAGPETVSAVIAEPVQSAGGTIIPPVGYLARLREICDAHAVLLIADEVITGFGRTGKFFGCQHDGVVPDILSVAKGITSGYLPLSAAIATEAVAEPFLDDRSHENVHPGTYCGHPVSCVAALANFEILEKEDLAGNAARVGAHLLERLRGLQARHPIVGEARGRGLILAADLRDPRTGGPPAAPPGGAGQSAGLRSGPHRLCPRQRDPAGPAAGAHPRPGRRHRRYPGRRTDRDRAHLVKGRGRALRVATGRSRRNRRDPWGNAWPPERRPQRCGRSRSPRGSPE